MSAAANRRRQWKRRAVRESLAWHAVHTYGLAVLPGEPTKALRARCAAVVRA